MFQDSDSLIITLSVYMFAGASVHVGDAGDACAITLLLKVLPFLFFVGIAVSLVFCGG